MVRLARSFITEQTEKKENVTDADPLVSKVRLSCAHLPECTATIKEHGILVAEAVWPELTVRSHPGCFPEPE